MPDARRLATLRGMIDLRRLQVRAAEMRTLHAQIEAEDEIRRTREASTALAADNEHWERLNTTRRLDPDAAARWNSAIRQDLRLLSEREAACQAAQSRETAARNAWHEACERERAAEESHDKARRADRKRADEAGLHQASQHFLASRGRRS